MTDTYNLSELPGRLYQFAGIAGPLKDGKQNWKYPPGLFRYICKARDYRTDTEKIVYQGVGGVADGKFWLAPIFDWASQFTLVPEPVESVPEPDPVPEVEPIPERVAGAHTPGERFCI